MRFCPRDGTTIVPPQPSEIRPRRSAPVTIDPGDPLIGRLLDGRYKIRARLGSGGVGSVYEAEHMGTKRPVAIKVLHEMFAGSDEFRKRFEREAQAASKLQHPGCVAVLDFGRVERVEPAADTARLHGMHYLVMEFVRGELLLERLEAKGRVPPGEAIAIARGVLGALGHAHGLGMVHRDVKPANIILTQSGAVKLLDFGLAKDTSAEPGAEPLTQAGMVFGTPGYLSPEQASGKPIDARSDLYAAGVVLFEMVCGRRLFPREDPIDVVRDHLSREPDAPRTLVPQLSAELEAVILRALAKSPDARFASAKELVKALDACPEARAAQTGTAPTIATTVEARAAAKGKRDGGAARDGRGAARDGRRRVPVTVLAIGGAGLAALAVVLALVLGRSPPPAPVAAPVAAAPPAPVADGARHHLGIAVAYQRKLWCSDAIEELDRAVRADPRVRTDPDVTRVAIACLTPKTQAKAIRFLVEQVGPSAVGPLTAAASDDPSIEVRQGAERALERLK
jgi:eukaryotic-like serine/threonine-protein kinase